MSPTFEQYLYVLYSMHRHGEPIRVSRLAGRLSVTAPSVSAALRRMERADLVVIDASRQVTPTAYALETAEALIRRHMLVELFLSGILNLAIDDVQRESLRMDHVFTPAMEMRVNSVLGHPTACPHAIAIPQSSSDRGAAASGTASPWFIDELAAPAATQHWYRHGLLPRERVAPRPAGSNS